MKKTVTTTVYDVAEYLRTPEEMAAYLQACFEEAGGDAGFITKALGDVARAKSMTQVARDAGLSRESLYKALSGDRSPGFDTVMKVLRALGLELRVAASGRVEASSGRMTALIEDKLEAIADICRKYGVVSLHLFGSALGEDFRLGESDVDLLVEFGLIDGAAKAHCYFDMLDELRALLGTEVDLVMTGAVKNRYLKDDIERTKRLLYAA
jgi:probable addiction module antidote protein